MDISLEKKTQTEALIKINLKESDYQPKVALKVKDYAKKAEIKGFRKGKVPTSVINRMYGKSILVDEINHILSHALTDYIKDNDIKIIGEPLPNREQADKIDWDTPSDFDFEYNIGLIDAFEIDLSKKQKVTRNEIKVDKAIIDETVDNLKDQYSEMTNPEVCEDGDSIYGEFQQVDGDISNAGILDLPLLDTKVAKQFIGSKSGDRIKFDVTKTLKDENLITQVLGVDLEVAKTLTGEFEIEVKNINRKVPAEINQDLFDKLFGKDSIKSEDEFIEKVKETIEKNYSKESDHLLEMHIRKQLSKSTKIEVPNDFLKEWLFVSNEGKLSKEQIDEEFDSYVDELKWSLIRNKITEDKDIKVEQEDVKNKAKELIIEQFGGPAVAEQLQSSLDEFADNYLKANEGQNYVTVFNQLQGEKVYEIVKESITIKDKKVSLDDFKKLASE